MVNPQEETKIFSRSCLGLVQFAWIVCLSELQDNVKIIGNVKKARDLACAHGMDVLWIASCSCLLCYFIRIRVFAVSSIVWCLYQDLQEFGTLECSGLLCLMLNYFLRLLYLMHYCSTHEPFSFWTHFPSTKRQVKHVDCYTVTTKELESITARFKFESMMRCTTSLSLSTNKHCRSLLSTKLMVFFYNICFFLYTSLWLGYDSCFSTFSVDIFFFNVHQWSYDLILLFFQHHFMVLLSGLMWHLLAQQYFPLIMVCHPPLLSLQTVTWRKAIKERSVPILTIHLSCQLHQRIPQHTGNRFSINTFPPKKLWVLSILLFAFHASEWKVGLEKSELITINNLQPILVADFIKSTLGELDKYIIHCTCHRWTCKYIPRPFEICLL